MISGGDNVRRKFLKAMTLAAGVGLVASSFAPTLAAEPEVEPPVEPPVVLDPSADSVGVVDESRGYWWLRDAGTGQTTSFYYGNPGDVPFTGDWDCDGVDTPGLYRQSDGYVYVRNSNSQGVADVAFFFGNPGDFPVAGDFNGDGCDTVSLYRQVEGTFYVINRLGEGDAGLGAADSFFAFGDPDDSPFAGDFDGDGFDTLAMQDTSTNRVYLRNLLSAGEDDVSFYFGDRGDVALPGVWAGGPDSVGLYRSSNATFYLSPTAPPTTASEAVQYGFRRGTPITGSWGTLPGGDEAPTNKPYLVSQFTTYHPSGQARNININLIADMTNGAVVQPGEVFSLNERVGQRTEAKGFVRAGAIIGGVVYCCDSPTNIGGGTSQFATTLYNAIFFGAYDDVYHRPHSLYFSRYPVVREATLGWTSPDVKFKNDTAFPVTIRTSHTSTSITVQMWGDNEGRSVSTYTNADGITSDGGGRGTTYRTITYANGSTATESWTHTYRAKKDSSPEPSPPPPPPPPPGGGWPE
jgi:hypothetical protein